MKYALTLIAVCLFAACTPKTEEAPAPAEETQQTEMTEQAAGVTDENKDKDKEGEAKTEEAAPQK